MRLRVVRWFFSQPAAMFYSLAAIRLHESLGAPSGSVVSVFASMLFLSSMGLWVLSDARERRRSLPYDFGSFVFCAWPLVVPIYLFSTRRWRALLTIGLFVLLYAAAMLFGSISVMLRSMQP